MRNKPVFQPGHRCGPYTIARLIASGGLSQVYEALHPFTKRRVAIKVLHPTYALDDTMRARFRAEAKFLTEFQDPHVVTLYEANMTDDGLIWLCMELVNGRTLGQCLEEDGPFPIPDALYVLRRVALGLSAAHGNGGTHRDMKPDNVMVTTSGQVKVLDFGMGKFVEYNLKLTDPGRGPGTPEYMSPEQVSGRPADFRSDIYAVGAIGYELLTGKHMFLSGLRPDEDTTPSRTQLALFHVTKRPAPLARLVHQLPLRAASCLERALEKDPANRQSSMAELAEDFRDARNAFLEAFPNALLRYADPDDRPGGRRSAPPAALARHREPQLEPPRPAARLLVPTQPFGASSIVSQPGTTPFAPTGLSFAVADTTSLRAVARMRIGLSGRVARLAAQGKRWIPRASPPAPIAARRSTRRATPLVWGALVGLAAALVVVVVARWRGASIALHLLPRRADTPAAIVPSTVPPPDATTPMAISAGPVATARTLISVDGPVAGALAQTAVTPRAVQPSPTASAVALARPTAPRRASRAPATVNPFDVDLSELRATPPTATTTPRKSTSVPSSIPSEL